MEVRSRPVGGCDGQLVAICSGNLGCLTIDRATWCRCWSRSSLPCISYRKSMPEASSL